MSLFYRLSLLLCLISHSASLTGQPVSGSRAREAALLQLNRMNAIHQRAGLKSTGEKLEEAHYSEISQSSGRVDTLYRIFNISGGNGFIIVSGDERVPPVLGYSLTGSFMAENQPPAFTEWMESRRREILHITGDEGIDEMGTASSEWQNLTLKRLSLEEAVVDPLIKTTWNQGCYYNALCPEDVQGNCGRTWTGCVATSMAQIMEYWNYPARGTGSRTYSHSTYGTLSADFGNTTYEWSKMPSKLTSNNLAVATLMYHCGVAVDMNYGTSSSSASWPTKPRNALVNYFNYSSNAQYVFKKNYSDQSWLTLVKTELEAARPVWYVGGSHAFICDGYQADNYFHFNWGWGGYYDGYFLIGSLNPGSENFTENQSAIIKIFPPGVPDAAGVISGPQAVCRGTVSVTYSVPLIEKATSYAWTVPAGVTGSSTTNSITVSFTDNAQTGYVRVKGVNDEGSGVESILRITVSSAPDQPGTISGSTSVCPFSSLTYSVPAVSGMHYVWSFPTGWVQTAGGNTNQVTVTSGFMGGVITVSPSNQCGDGPSRSLAISVLSKPSQPGAIEGASTVSVGTSQTYSVPVTSGILYHWSFPSGWLQTAGGNGPAVTVTVGSASGVVSVTPSNGCGEGTAQTLNVTSSDIPSQPGPISGSGTVCAGNSETYSVPLTGGISYAWSFPSGWIQTGGGNTNIVTVLVGSGSGNISVTPSNFSGEGTARVLPVIALATPQKPGVISGSEVVCLGSEQTYSIEGLPGISYSWQFPEGWVQTSGGNGDQVTVTTGQASGLVSVTPSNSCGTGPMQTKSVAVSDRPGQPGGISGPAFVCRGTSLTYSVPSIPGVTFQWSFPSGWILTSGGNASTVTVIAGSTGGMVTVTPTNHCGEGTPRSFNVAVNDIPVRPAAITGLTEVCAGTELTYAVPAVSGVFYYWGLPAGWTKVTSGYLNSITVIAGTGSGVISVTPFNECGEGEVVSLSVTSASKPGQPGTIAGPVKVCAGTEISYSVPYVADVKYTWSFPAGWIQTSGGTTNAVSVIAGTGSGRVSVVPSNRCGSGSASDVAVVVSSNPVKPGIIQGAASVCEGSSQTYGLPAVEGVFYRWNFPAGWTQTSGGNSNIVTVKVGSASGQVTATPSNECGIGPLTSQYVIVSPIPDKPVIVQDGNQLRSNALFGNQWYNSSGIIKSATSQTITAKSNETYFVVVSLDGCVSQPSDAIVAIISDFTAIDWENGLQVYPNPVTENLTVRLKGVTGPVKYTLLNTIGQALQQSSFDGNADIEMKRYPAGFYFLRLEKENAVYIRKVEKR